MAKYTKDLDENLVNKVKQMAVTYGLGEVKVEALRQNKIGKNVVEILKGNDLVKLFAGKDVVALALCEEAFLNVDEKNQNLWLETALAQIYYDPEKEQIKIEKPELNIPIGIYNKYNTVALDSAVLADLTLEQLREQEKERKEQEKLLKKTKKQ